MSLSQTDVTNAASRRIATGVYKSADRKARNAMIDFRLDVYYLFRGPLKLFEFLLVDANLAADDEERALYIDLYKAAGDRNDPNIGDYYDAADDPKRACEDTCFARRQKATPRDYVIFLNAAQKARRRVDELETIRLQGQAA